MHSTSGACSAYSSFLSWRCCVRMRSARSSKVFNPDCPLGGPAGLRVPWRSFCGVRPPSLCAHSPRHGLVASAKIHSHNASPSSRVLMDNLGSIFMRGCRRFAGATIDLFPMLLLHGRLHQKWLRPNPSAPDICRTALLPACPSPDASRSATSPAAAWTTEWIRCGRWIAGRRWCHGRSPG